MSEAIEAAAPVRAQDDEACVVRHSPQKNRGITNLDRDIRLQPGAFQASLDGAQVGRRGRAIGRVVDGAE